MSVPGSNLLNQAMRLIASQAVEYYRATGRTVNDLGQFITSYEDPVTMYGSFQAVPKQLYQAYGLDWQRSYFTFYTSNPIKDVARDLSPDVITYGGDRYQCESNNDWYKVDGWRGVLCVLLDAGPVEPPFTNPGD